MRCRRLGHNQRSSWKLQVCILLDPTLDNSDKSLRYRSLINVWWSWCIDVSDKILSGASRAHKLTKFCLALTKNCHTEFQISKIPATNLKWQTAKICYNENFRVYAPMHKFCHHPPSTCAWNRQSIASKNNTFLKWWKTIIYMFIWTSTEQSQRRGWAR